MSELIPVTDDSVGLGGGASAIIAEIVGMLGELEQDGISRQIDIKSMPLSKGEVARLKEVLGEGEARIELELNGPSRCQETAFPGVWWIQHMSADGTLVAELIEVARVPDILAYDETEISESIASLSERLRHSGSNLQESQDE